MEGIFHFQGQRRLSTMAKQYTIQPCFSDNEGNTSSGDELEQEQPQLVSKKSHFSIRSESNSQESKPMFFYILNNIFSKKAFPQTLNTKRIHK